MNCWEFRKCGREPNGVNAKNSGVCPAAASQEFNGYNGGRNAGRSCWMISGTLCDGEVMGTFVEKAEQCKTCPFYKSVDGEGNGFFLKPSGVVSSDSKRAYESKIITSRSEDEQVIMYLLGQLSLKEESKTVRLVTPYKELPITNFAEIVEIKGSSVTFATNELQIAAIRTCEETLIGTSHCPEFFLGCLKDIDVRRSTVTLNNFSYAELYTDCRRTVRVRLPKPLNVMMKAGPNNISGVIQDISFGGCGMNTLAIAPLDGVEQLVLKLKLFDVATAKMLESDIACHVVRILNNRPPYKVAIAFDHNPDTELLVSKFIHQRELEIVKELRDLM